MLDHLLLRRIVHPLGTPDSDLELLDRWVAGRDQSAFELLVWRHGAMVLAACRRSLPPADAEDAFQATFLALARKAASVGHRGSVGGWLHRVAVRVARAARVRAACGPVALAPEPASPDGAGVDAEVHELRAVLDEELDRLPDRFRRVLVLCYLQGKTADEAARELGHPRGTVLSWLMRGRERLRGRLVRRGVALSAAAVLTTLERAGAEVVPSRLVASTLNLGAVPAMGPGPATELAKGVLRAMWWKPTKACVAAAFLLASVGVGVELWRASAADPGPKAAEPVDKPDPKAEEKAKKEMGKLKGKWQLVSVGVRGQAQVDLGCDVWEIGEGKLTITRSGPKNGTDEKVAESAFTIDPTQKPAHIDAEVEIAGIKLAKGIYELNGDKLVVCLTGGDRDRPTEFSTGEKGGDYLLILKREKPADPEPLKVGQKAPEFKVTDPSGRTTFTVAGLLKDKKAAVVCVWCAACLGGNDIPAMNDFHSRIQGLPVSFVAVEAYETADELKDLVRAKRVTFPVGCAKATEPYRTVLGPKGYRCFKTFVIGADGEVKWVGGHFGLDGNDPKKEESLRKRLAELDAALKTLGVDVPAAKP